MTWTTDLPEAPGFYWARFGAEDQEPNIVEVIPGIEGGWEVFMFGGSEDAEPLQRFVGDSATPPVQWIGPLKPPN